MSGKGKAKLMPLKYTEKQMSGWVYDTKRCYLKENDKTRAPL